VGIVCGAKRKSIPADLIDTMLGESISALSLPDDWQTTVLQGLHGADQSAARIQ
jgi:hypothetical protein